MNVKAVIIRPGVWGLSKNDLRNAGRAAIHETGLYWHRNLKAHHFQLYAFGRYGYPRRDRRYESKKRKEHPESQGRPLVFTGESERLAMASEKVVAKAQSWERYSADVVIDGPNLNFHAEEMTKVTTYETELMSNVFAVAFTRNYLAIAEVHVETLRLAG